MSAEFIPYLEEEACGGICVKLGVEIQNTKDMRIKAFLYIFSYSIMKNIK